MHSRKNLSQDRGWRFNCRLAAVFAFVLVSSLFASGTLRTAAAGREQDFVEALRTHGWHDLALDYLQSAPADPLVGEEFRTRIPYERAVTLLDRMSALRDRDDRVQALREARGALKPFLNAGGSKSLAAEAHARLGGALVAEAEMTLRISEQSADGSGDQEKIRSDARALLEDARSLLATSQRLYEELLEPLAVVEPGSDEGAERSELRWRAAMAQVSEGSTYYFEALTYPRDSAEWRDVNTDASKRLTKLADQHDGSYPGWTARLYEGQCHQNLGEAKLAIGCYEEVLYQTAEAPEAVPLATHARTLLTEMLVASEQYDRALEEAGQWLEKLGDSQQAANSAATLKYEVAEAARLKAAALGPQDSASRRLLLDARELLRESSRTPHTKQRDARLRLQEVSAQLGVNERQARTFDEAYQTGKDAIESMKAAQLTMKLAERNNPEAAPALERQAAEGQLRAMQSFRLALQLADDSTPVAQLNETRYLLSLLYWQTKDYYRAALLADFLVAHYPQDPAAESAAAIALNAYQLLGRQSSAEGAGGSDDFETRRLRQLSETITRSWPGSSAAEAAFSVLLGAALREDRLEDAEKVLQDVAPDKRSEYELRLASAMWERARSNAGQATTAAERKAADAASQDAFERLQSGVEKARSAGVVSRTTAVATLYAAAGLLDQGDAPKAIELLEDKRLGPLTLVEQGASVAASRAFAIETYKTALHAYASTTPPRLEQINQTLDALERHAGGAQGGDLSKIYLALGVQLDRKLEELRASGEQARASQISAAFPALLERLVASTQNADWSTQLWIAQTSLKLGDELAAGGGGQDASQAYIQKARDAAQRLVDLAERNPGFAPGTSSVMAARFLLGRCEQKVGNYADAMEAYVALLSQKEAMLDVQKAAAYTLQEWGAEDPRHFEEAIRGASRNASGGGNLVWGWLKLARVADQAARSNPKYRDLFYEAWLNVARTRYLSAMEQSGAARAKELQRAASTIRSTATARQDLGGPRWRAEFDTLLKSVQRAQGEEPQGLAAFNK